MDAPVKCVAVHCVTADRLYGPGEPLELCESDADALEAAGAVERVLGDEVVGEPYRPVTLVKGIGPKTAKQLSSLGIETLGDLASITPPEGLARVAGAIDVIGDELAAVTRWRDEARALLDAEADGA